MMRYPGSPGYVNGSETSEDAAASMVPSAATLRAQIEHYMQRLPSTCDEIEVALSLRHQTASARIRELVLQGRLRDSDHVRDTRSGRSAVIWEVIPRRRQLGEPKRSAKS